MGLAGRDGGRQVAVCECGTLAAEIRLAAGAAVAGSQRADAASQERTQRDSPGCG